MHNPALWSLVGLILAGCGGASGLSGDGGGDDGSVPDPINDTLADSPECPDGQEAADMPDAIDPVEDVPQDGCCTPPMVLDLATGICVDPQGIENSCEGDQEGCAFGQRCTMEWGEGPIGSFCHFPCGMFEDRLCPAGYFCDPVLCCDIPNRDCVRDPCEPPLFLHPMTGTCASDAGLGMDCSTTESCGGPGQDCLVWQGLDGSDYHTCEIRCVNDNGGNRVCPNEYVCEDIDDGPQNVCRRRWDMAGCDDPGALVCGLPDKFSGVARDSVCSGCYGVIFCVSESETSSFTYLFPENAVTCDPAAYPICPAGFVGCLFRIRSGVDDCPDMMPSDFYWSSVCLAARVDYVQSVNCYWLE